MNLCGAHARRKTSACLPASRITTQAHTHLRAELQVFLLQVVDSCLQLLLLNLQLTQTSQC